MSMLRACLASVVVCSALAAEAVAGGVAGRVEFPPAPERPPPAVQGFLERTKNPLANIKPFAVAPRVIVVLEGDAKPESPGQSVWELVGESFARPVLAVPVGGEVVIKNVSKTPRTLVALEDPKLVPAGPINPTGPKSFRPTAPAVYTLTDKEAPHLRGTLVIVGSPYFATPDASGKFDLADVAEGTYNVRVFVALPASQGWIERPAQTVEVPAKGKAELTVKIPAGYPVAGAGSTGTK